MRLCNHYKQFSKIVLVNELFTFLIWNSQMSGQYPGWDITFVWKPLIEVISLILLVLILIFYITWKYFFTLHHYFFEIIRSSNLKFLPIFIRTNFSFVLFQIFSSPNLTQTFSYLCPETKRWHLFLLSFMLLVCFMLRYTFK